MQSNDMSLKTALIFGNEMVLQRDKPLAIWGDALPGKKVELGIQGKYTSVIAGENGTWKAIIPPLAVSECEILTICCEKEKLEYTNVAVGEVWIAGGQSNMEFVMQSEAMFQTEIEQCENPRIRFFDYPKISYEQQISLLPHKTEGFWRRCDKDNLKYYSAVGYYYAKTLEQELHIPIGIVGCNWGGSTASCWMDGEYCKEIDGKSWWEEYEETVKSLKMNEYEEALKTDYNVLHSDWIDTQMPELLSQEATLEGLKAAYLEYDMPILVGPKSPNRPSGLYETMLKKLVPYGMRGVIWYQGESDDVKAEMYGEMQTALIKNWRELWEEEFPFLFVQLPPFQGYGRATGANFPEIRRQQQAVAESVENVGMVVTSDLGSQYDLHPKQKGPVGDRLALMALTKVYDKEIICESPSLVSGYFEADTLVLKFENVGAGLQVRGERIEALEILQNNLLVTDYSFTVQKNCIVIRYNAWIDAAEIIVRFACQPYYQVNLYNSVSLPARPSEIKI